MSATSTKANSQRKYPEIGGDIVFNTPLEFNIPPLSEI
jgi:hypothetical protein